jgi:TonB family protein
MELITVCLIGEMIGMFFCSIMFLQSACSRRYMGVQYSSMTFRVFLLGFASFVTCLAQSGGSRQLRPQAFVPSGASITKQMSVDFEGDRVPEIVQMYSVPEASDSKYQTDGINVLKLSPQSGWILAYREEETIMPGADRITTEVVTGTGGKCGVVVISYHSGAGTVTVWHLLASVDRKIAKLDPAKMRAKALEEREYADNGYNGVKTNGDLIIEDLAGYTRHMARCCPNRPSLELSFRFTGRALVLDSVKEVPYERPPGGIGPLLRLHEKGLWAYGYQLADGFLVYGGSESPKDASPSTPPAILALRKSLIEEELFGDAGDHLALSGLHKFASRSEAAAVMLARSVDGDREWKDENGRPVRAPRAQPINLTVLGYSGMWSGFEERKGSRYVLVARLEQRGQSISGKVGDRPIVNGGVEGDLLSFDVQETIYAASHFQLTLADGRLRGERRDGSETWPVTLKRWDESYSNSSRRTSLPVLVYRSEPQYPEGSAARTHGPVVLQIEIDKSGRVSPDRIKVLRSIGTDFDQKAIECVKQWRFQPGYIEGNSVSTSASVEVVFTP